MKLVFTPLAIGDLHEILTYIAQRRPRTARAVVKRIREKCEFLASQLLLGEKLPMFGDNLRCFPIERWIIFYRVNESTVEIHRILDGARDWPSLLS